MNKCCKNMEINNKLSELYICKTEEFLSVWKGEPQTRINEFGIIDVHNYEPDIGVLFVGKETNGWGVLGQETFLSWINDIITGKQKTARPQIWYNLGRWAKFIADPTFDKEELVNEQVVALSGLRKIAFTNVNKVGGGSVSGNEFWDLIKEEVVVDILCREVEEIKPILIVFCGIKKKCIPKIIQWIENFDKKIKIIEMPHPSARNISKLDMLSRLENQLKEAGWGGCYD